MSRVPFTTGKGWFPRVFPGFVGPAAIDDTVILTSPQEGFARYAEQKAASASGTAIAEININVVNPVPGDKVWLVTACGAYHQDDTPLVTALWIHLQDPINNEYPLVAGGALAAHERLAVNRQFIVPPRWSLRASIPVATAAAKGLFIFASYIELPIGEYVPPV